MAAVLGIGRRRVRWAGIGKGRVAAIATSGIERMGALSRASGWGGISAKLSEVTGATRRLPKAGRPKGPALRATSWGIELGAALCSGQSAGRVREEGTWSWSVPTGDASLARVEGMWLWSVSGGGDGARGGGGLSSNNQFVGIWGNVWGLLSYGVKKDTNSCGGVP